MSWPEVLSKLRQLPRPHLAQEAANSSSAGSCAGGEAGAVAGCGADVSSGTAGAEEGVGDEDDSLSTEMRLALGNGVTGIGRPRSRKVAARNVAGAREEVRAMPACAPKVVVGELVLVGTPNCADGEFYVSLGRVEACDDRRREARIAWFARKGKAGAWGSSATFVPWMPKRRVEYSLEPYDDVLPVPVELTASSTVPAAGSIAKSRLRLSKRCVDKLRLFVALVRQDLAAGDSFEAGGGEEEWEGEEDVEDEGEDEDDGEEEDEGEAGEGERGW